MSDPLSGVFTARYSGRCHADCGVSVEPGDDVRMTDDGVVHATCADPPPEPREHPVCDTCWLTHPPESECR